MKNDNKIFGIGLSRTGTTSLHNALKLLNIRSKHFPLSLYICNNKSILNEFDAFVDSPIPLIYKQLDEKFPNSKFILTTRSLESWLQSMKWLYNHASVIWRPSLNVYRYRKEFYGCLNFNNLILEKKYHDYHSDVENYFKNRRKDILVLDVDENNKFEKLSDFLNLPSIQLEYPRSNEKFYVSYHRRFIYHNLTKNLIYMKYHVK